MSAPSPSLSRAWIVVALLAPVAALAYLDRVMITTMRVSVLEAIPMTEAQFGLLTSAFLWTYAAMSPFGGFLADRLNRSLVITASLFLWSAITWLTAYATTFEALLLTRAVLGISQGCYMPAALALITDHHRGPTRSLATSIHTIGVSVGSGLGGVGGWLAERQDWTFAFALFGAIGVGYSVALAAGLRDAPAKAPAETRAPVRFRDAMSSLFRIPSFHLALLYWGLLAIAGWASVGWLPTLLGEKFHLSQGKAGMSATAYLPPATWVGALLGGFLSDRWAGRHPRGRIFVAMIGLGFSAPCTLVALEANSLPVTIVAFMLWSSGFAFATINMMPILCLIADERYRATGFGVLNLFSCFMGGLTIYLGGIVRDAQVNVDVVFRAGALVTLVCVGLLWLIRPTAGVGR
ncbi:MAG: MFS transporter [Opitutaceae bacterium]|nr:MFS transporter [Opitutaceae bacterium]